MFLKELYIQGLWVLLVWVVGYEWNVHRQQVCEPIFLSTPYEVFQVAPPHSSGVVAQPGYSPFSTALTTHCSAVTHTQGNIIIIYIILFFSVRSDKVKYNICKLSN